MKIAVASNGLDVAPFFEGCTNYNYFTIENGEMLGYRNLPILNTSSLSTLEILKELEVDVIIAGCLKKSSRKILEDNGIKVLCGASGGAKQIVDDFLANVLIACDGSCDAQNALEARDTPIIFNSL